MIRREKLAPGNYYHIYSRTILNIPEFKNQHNALRLKQAFLLANSTKSTEAFNYFRNNADATAKGIENILANSQKLTNILSYVIMPDHYHLLVQEVKDGGITEFVKKCNISIAKYINIKNERKGSLFESRFRAKHIDSNTYLLHLSLYIHLNPLDVLDSRRWREHGLKNWSSKKKLLLNYPWSSLKSFIVNNYDDPILSGLEIITDQFGDKKDDYESFLREWSVGESDKFLDLLID